MNAVVNVRIEGITEEGLIAVKARIKETLKDVPGVQITTMTSG